MKSFFTKKKNIKVLSAFLALCLTVGIVNSCPFKARGSVSADALISFGSFNIEDSGDGAKVTHTAEGESWERVFHTSQYDAQVGIHLEITDITTTAQNYSFVVTWGSEWIHWSNMAGYMLVYGSNGHLEIFPTKTNDSGDAVPGAAGSEIVNIDREALSGKLAIDIQLVEGSYVITVNGDTYTIPAVNPYGNADSGTQMSIDKAKNIYFAFDMKGGIDEETDNIDLTQKVPAGSSFVVSDISYNYQAPVIAKAEGIDTVENLTPADMVLMAAENYMTVQDENGVKVSYDSATQGWGRICTNNPYNAETGIHVEVKDITARDNHSFALSLGNEWAAQWSDKKGYVIVYDNVGTFAIHSMKGTQWSEIDKTLVSLKREALGSALTMDIKLQDNDYVITVNGKTYTIPAQNSEYPLSSLTELYVAMGLFGARANAGAVPGDSITNAGFTITKVCNWVPQDSGNEGSDDGGSEGDAGGSGSGDEEDDYVITSVPEGVVRIGDHFEFRETNEGLAATHHAKAAAWERFWFADPEWVEEDGLQLEIKNITSESDNYSLAVGLSSDQNYWYDQKGIMILYGKGGNLSIIGTTSETADPNEAEVLASGKVTYKDTLSVNTRKEGDKYVLTMNGTAYTVDGKWLGNSDAIYYAFGVLSDYKLADGDVSELQYYQNDFKNANVSFTIMDSKDAGTEDDVREAAPNGYVVNPEDVEMSAVGDNIVLHKQDNGIKVIHTAQAAGWERVGYTKTFAVSGNGMHIQMEEITSKASDYTLAIAIGNALNQWGDQTGYMILYGKNGDFSIIATDPSITDFNQSPVVVSGKREALGDLLSVDIKLKNDNYIITVNGIVYTIPARHGNFPLTDVKGLYVSFGIVGGGKIGGIDFASDNFKRNYVSFVLTEVTDEIDLGREFGLHVTGYDWELTKTSRGTKITNGVDGAGWERISTKQGYFTTGDGISIELADIESKEPNYSIAVMLGNGEDVWYDCRGYMIIYGRSGNFSIVANDVSIINPNKSPVVVSEVREELGSTLSINVKLVGEEYEITVNGKAYSLPAHHKKWPVDDVKCLFASFGVMSDGEIGEVIYNIPFKKSPVSFVLASITGSDEDITQEKPIEEDEHEPVSAENEDKPKVDAAEEKKINVPALICVTAVAFLFAAGITGCIIWYRKRKAKEEQHEKDL